MAELIESASVREVDRKNIEKNQNPFLVMPYFAGGSGGVEHETH